MIDSIRKNEQAGLFSRRQQLFVKYTLFILIDLAILNLFNEFWKHVFVENFSVSLLVAIMLQALLQITIAIEHRVSKLFKGKTSLKSKILRGFSVWAILFVSKLVILEALDYAFGDSISFGGPFHGLVTFIVLVTVMIVTEQIFIRIYKALA